MAVAPGESVVFVASSNSDLTYNGGTVVALDVDAIDQVANAWTTSGTIPPDIQDMDVNGDARTLTCAGDLDHIETLRCDAPRFVVKRGDPASAQIGNFATDIAVQDLGNSNLRLFVPTRGDPSVTWLDWNGDRLVCTDKANASFPTCDPSHQLVYVHDDPDLALLPQEPFGAFADSAGHFAVITHLSSGAVTLIDSPPDGPAVIADVATGLFAADPSTGLRGATGVVGRTPSSPGDIIYVGSRSEDRIQTLTVGRPVNDAPPYLIQGNWFFLDSVGNNAGESSDTRGMAFSPDGKRLYVINRNPPTLQLYDTSLDASGFPRNQLVAATDICRDASTLAVMDAGDGERAYVSCFDDGQLYVIDPQGSSMVTNIIPVGRGPYAVAVAPNHKKVFVTNFLENTVAVVDVAPTSPLRDRVVLRIGKPKQP